MIRHVVSQYDWDDAITESELHLVHFAVTDCPSYSMLSSVMEESNQTSEALSNVLTMSVNVETCPDIIDEYNIKNMPTFLFFNGGNVIGRYSGMDSIELDKKIETAFAVYTSEEEEEEEEGDTDEEADVMMY
jgi:thioredoxin-like negative regulator of GroEL